MAKHKHKQTSETDIAHSGGMNVDVPGMMERLVGVLSDDEVTSLHQHWNNGNNKVRVATVCSGTDAPILALQWLLAALKGRSPAWTMELEHVMSCENVPFKREFIQSTTNPTLLFTDVTELAKSGQGTCHDGKVREVPRDFTVLVAGTECVDFSSLSTAPKGLRGGGRSDITFWATLELVKLRQPPLVLLENVSKCPAEEMKRAFEDAGYAAVHHKLCTSDYLLPQSRSRAYFLFLHKHKARFLRSPDDWIAIMERLGPKRTLLPNEMALQWTDFLDKNDHDNHGQQPADATTANKKKKARGKPLSQSLASKWLAEITKIEINEQLTPYNKPGGRPYTDATNNDQNSYPELAALPDRAKMRLDVQFKRAMKAGLDPLTVPLLWNPAQQLRFTDAGFSTANNGAALPKPIAPCVTPTHEWIVSTRKGPLSGRECLALQGITGLPDSVWMDFDDKQLRDLAGNAMSTTVVAAACLACFVTCELINTKSGDNVAAEAAMDDSNKNDSNRSFSNDRVNTKPSSSTKRGSASKRKRT